MNNKLNTLMAEKVMGWESRKADKYHNDDWYIDRGKTHYIEMPISDWNPTKDMNQAMMCADKLRPMNLEEKFIESLILRLDLNVSLFYSALEGGGYTGGDVPKAIFSMITAPPLAICEAIREAMKK